jgi:hypothetical protein
MDSGPFFGYDDAGANASQIQAALLEQSDGSGQSFGAQLHHA